MNRDFQRAVDLPIFFRSVKSYSCLCRSVLDISLANEVFEKICRRSEKY